LGAFYFFLVFTSFYRTTQYAVYAVVVCLSICLSVCVSITLRYCIKTATRRITQIMPLDSSFHQCPPQNSNVITPYGGEKCRWARLKFATFDEKMRYNSKTIQDGRIVSIKVK